jgi:hypothetical protein
MELISPKDAQKMFPLMDIEGVLGAAYTPNDGSIDPTGLTNALAAGAAVSGETGRRTLWSPRREYSRDWLLFRSNILSGPKECRSDFLDRCLSETNDSSVSTAGPKLGLEERVRIIESNSSLINIADDSVDLVIFRGALFFPTLFRVDFERIPRKLTNEISHHNEAMIDFRTVFESHTVRCFRIGHQLFCIRNRRFHVTIWIRLLATGDCHSG